MVSLPVGTGWTGVKAAQEGFGKTGRAGSFEDEVNSFLSTLVLMATGWPLLWVFST